MVGFSFSPRPVRWWGQSLFEQVLTKKGGFMSLAAQKTALIAAETTPLIAALEQLGPHDHFCSIYESPQEHYAVAIPFIRIGLERGEKCIYIADDGAVGDVRQAMQSEGIDVDRAIASKALVLATKDQTYLEHGSFHPDWMFTFWKETTQLALSEGFSAVRATGETEWVLRGARGLERWMEYESRLTHTLSVSNCSALCQYNRRLFPPEVILDVIRTHPMVVYGSTVCRNLYYVPPEEFLGANQTAREVERLLTNIRERERVDNVLREQLTERKRAEEELRESEEQWRDVFENNPTMYFMVEAAGTVLSVNPFGAEQLGYTVTELVGQPVLSVFPAPDREVFQRNIASCLEQLGQAKSWEARKVRKDGTVILVRETAKAVPRVNGPIVLIACEDITEQRRAAEALRQSQADLAHVSRMTTMGELTASLAHEVNQPITAAVINANSCVRWLAGDTPNIEEARDAAIRSAKDGTRAAEIISRIRLLFEKGALERELVDVNEVIREMIVLLRGEATGYSVSIRTDLAPDLPQLMADRVQLQQVLMNLMLNGIDAMKEVDGARELIVKSRPTENEQLVVSLSDTGVGLPPDQADQIFDAFFTTKLHGTGMGLSLSRSIVESHGGHLWADRNSPRGATFHLTLPIKVEVDE
jgi:PAS domain S-box-containing protein